MTLVTSVTNVTLLRLPAHVLVLKLRVLLAQA